MFMIGGGSAIGRIGASVIGGTANSVLFLGTGGVLDESTLLTYDDSTKRLTVGTGSGTSAGLHLGYATISGFGGFHSTGVTPSATNYALIASATSTQMNATSTLSFNISDVPKMQQAATAGAGPSITAGTATKQAPTNIGSVRRSTAS